MGPDDTGLTAEAERDFRDVSARDARALFARALKAAEPALRGMPEAARNGAIKALWDGATERTRITTQGETRKAAAGAVGLLGGGVAGVARALPPITGMDDLRSMGMVGSEAESAIADTYQSERSRDTAAQTNYEQTADPKHRESQGSYQNMKEGAAGFGNAMVALPGMTAGAVFGGFDSGAEFGETMGDAVVRDTRYLATNSRRALHNDPTRWLDVTPGTKAAGAGLRAAKFGLKAVGGALDTANTAKRIAAATELAVKASKAKVDKARRALLKKVYNNSATLADHNALQRANHNLARARAGNTSIPDVAPPPTLGRRILKGAESAAEVASELIDPSPDHRPTTVRESVPVDTEAAAKANRDIAEAVKSGRMTPQEAAHARDKAQSHRETVSTIGEDFISPAGRKATAVGRAIRRGVIAGTLGADALGPIAAAALGVAGAPLIGEAAIRSAQLVARRSGVVLTREEAKAALTRTFINANHQATPEASSSVGEAVVSPLHEALATETTSAPISEAIRSGELKAGVRDETLSLIDQAARESEFPIESRMMSFADGGITAHGKAADVARAAESAALQAGRESFVAGIEHGTARHNLKGATAGLDPDDVKDIRSSVSAGHKTQTKAGELVEAETKLDQMEPSKKALLLDETRIAQGELNKAVARAAAEDRWLRAQDAADGKKPRPTTAARTIKLKQAKADEAKAMARITALEEQAMAAGPEFMADFEKARALATEITESELRLKVASSKRSKGGAAVDRKAIAEYERARANADKSLANRALADKMAQHAIKAAEDWVEGAPVTRDVVLGLAIARREAAEAGVALSAQSKKLAALDKERKANGWTLGGAREENFARDTAKKLDESFDQAINSVERVDEKIGAVRSELMPDVEGRLWAKDELAAIPAGPRLLGEQAAEAAGDALEAIVDQHVLGKSTGMKETGAAADTLAETRAKSKAEGKATKTDSAFARQKRLVSELRTAAEGLLEYFRQGMLRNPAQSAEMAAVVAAKSNKTAKAEIASAAGRAQGKAMEGLESKGSRTFQRPENFGENSPAAMAAANGIISLLGGTADAFARVEDIIIRGINRASMIHALNPRVVGRVGKDFHRALQAQGVTTEIIAETNAFKKSPFAGAGATVQTALRNATGLKLGGNLESRVGMFIERVIQDVIVKQVQPSVVGGGAGFGSRSPEIHPVIQLPGGTVFDVGDAVMNTLSTLEGEGKVSAAELMGESVSAAFRALANQHLERKTTEAVGAEVVRGQSILAGANGNIGTPLTQFGNFAAASSDGARPSIVLFDTAAGSEGAKNAFGWDDPNSVIEAARAGTGVNLTPEALQAAKNDLSDNFMAAPASLERAVRKSLSERGVTLPVDAKISVRYGYGQSVGTHLDYLEAMRNVENLLSTGLRAMKRGLTVGSTGAMIMNTLSNLTLVSVMQGRSTLQTAASWGEEARLMHEFEKNGKAAGILTREGQLTHALLGTGIADSSFVRKSETLALGGESTKLPFQRGWDTYWDARTMAYQSVDAIPKMALARAQLKSLLSDTEKLGRGKTMSLDTGGGNRALLYRDDAGQLRLNGKVAEQVDIDAALAKQATRASAAALFDFNEAGLLFKKMFKGQTPGVFNELGSWFAKALEMPGRQGIFSTAMNFDPKTAYLTNDPGLQAGKAAALTGLMVRRTALHASGRAVQDENERRVGGAVGYARGPTTSTSRGADDGSGYDVNIADLSSSSWMEALLLQAESAVAAAGLVRDLLSSLYTKEDAAVADVMERRPGARQAGDYSSFDIKGLSPRDAAEATKLRDEAVSVDRRINELVHAGTGDRDLISSIVSMMQLTGGLLGRAVKFDDLNAGHAGQMILTALAGRDVATIAMAGRKEAKPDTKNPNAATNRSESMVRFVANGVFRLVGRETNSEDKISKREDSLIREINRHYAKAPKDDPERAYLKWIIHDEADRARAAIEAIRGDQ
jgi:hypothetical protein